MTINNQGLLSYIHAQWNKRGGEGGGKGEGEEVEGEEEEREKGVIYRKLC